MDRRGPGRWGRRRRAGSKIVVRCRSRLPMGDAAARPTALRRIAVAHAPRGSRRARTTCRRPVGPSPRRRSCSRAALRPRPP
eukprot:6531931-Prymnesium_polylepis.1